MEPFDWYRAAGTLVADRPPEAHDERSVGGRLLIVEHHALVAMGLQLALSERRWDVETTSGPTSDDVVAHARRFEPHCVLMDVHLGDDLGCGVGLIGPLAATGAQVVILTAERRRMVLAECLEAGAAGWIGKDSALDQVDSSLGHLLAGGTMIGQTDRAQLLHDLRVERADRLRSHSTFEQLTQREALVLGALIDGLSADEIAETHFVAVTTVRTQIRAVLQKLGVRSQLAAVAIASSHLDLLPVQARAGRDRRARRLGSGGPHHRR